MGDFLEYIGMGIVVLLVWLVMIGYLAGCAIGPLILWQALEDWKMLWWYALTLPLLGAGIGIIMYIQEL